MDASGGRLTVSRDAAPWIVDAVAGIPRDDRWSGIQVQGGPEGVRVDRSGSALDEDWLIDLWLAEHLAAAQPKAGA